MTQIFVLTADKADWPKILIKRARDEGAKEGAAGRPAPDATEIDAPEARLRGEVRERVLGTNGLLNNELNRISPEVARHRVELAESQHLLETRHVPEVSRQHCENALSGKRQQLVEAYERKHRTEGHYNLFRHRHGITHDPDHPEDKLHYLSLIFVFVAFETVLNAFFWTGSLGGFLTMALLISLVLSLVNVSVGFLTGAGFAYKNRSETRNHVLGWLSLIVGFCLICLINYYIITHRSTAGTFGGGEMGEGINKIFTVAMFVVGVFFAVFAMWKGYYFFGSVPGYESASREFLEAKRCVDDIIGHAKEDVNAERRSQEDLRRRLIDRSGDLKKKAAKLAADIQNVRTQYLLALDRLHDILGECVKSYRDANRAVRPNRASSPVYFAEPVERFVPQDEGLAAVEAAIGSYLSDVESHARVIQEVSTAENGQLREIAAQYVGPKISEWSREADDAGLKRYEDSIRTVGAPALRMQ